MSDGHGDGPVWSWRSRLSLIARLGLGALYVWMGLNKALEPVEFLKLTRQYDVVQAPFWLNLIAATLPWFEVFCGALLLTGAAVRGAALVSLGMLIPFTALVWRRAVEIQSAAGLPFCAVRFDCGCGAGEVQICYKLIENGLLVLLSIWLLTFPRSPWSLASLRAPGALVSAGGAGGGRL
jgi:uncharacterized membrane protein YphA (DoxX/SURF4 family)